MKRLFCRTLGMVLIHLLTFTLFLTGCQSEQKQQEEALQPKTDDGTLKVYAVGDEMLTSYGESYIQTWYTLGEFKSRAEVWGEEGYMYYNAIEDFQKQTSIDIEMTFFNSTTTMLDQVSNELENGIGPDVILGSYESDYGCLYPYIANDMFYDLSAFFEKDEIYTAGNYFEPVLTAGKINQKQYIFPLTFNMNILMTSQESLQRHQLRLTENQTYDEMINLFIDGWKESHWQDNTALMMQFSNMYNDFPYVLFDAASGVEIINYETGDITLDKNYFYHLAQLYEAFLYGDYGMDREGLKEMAAQHNNFLDGDSSIAQQKEILSIQTGLDGFNELKDSVGCFAEGGNCSFDMHSFAAQAGYYDSRYTDAGENFLCIGIPSKENAEGYTAQITNFGAVINGSPLAEEGYALLKHLADAKHFMYFDLPVNRQTTSEILDELCTTTYNFYPTMGQFPPDRVPEGEDWLGDAYAIQPMTETTRQYIEMMLQKIDKAILPDWKIRVCMTQEIEEYLWGSTESLDESYERALKKMKEAIS